MARKKNIHIHFCVDENEEKIIKKKMKEAGTNSYTDLFILAICRLKIYRVDVMPILELKEEINRIGTNINQIAKVANTTHNVRNNDIAELQKQLKGIHKIVRDFANDVYKKSR